MTTQVKDSKSDESAVIKLTLKGSQPELKEPVQRKPAVQVGDDPISASISERISDGSPLSVIKKNDEASDSAIFELKLKGSLPEEEEQEN